MLGRYHGEDGSLELHPDHLTLVSGHGERWTVPYRSLRSVQLKAAGALFNGHLKLTAAVERKGMFGAGEEEQSFPFSDLGTKNVAAANETMERVRQFLDQQRVGPGGPDGRPSLADEIAKLAALLDQGRITPEEYQLAKRKLLGP